MTNGLMKIPTFLLFVMNAQLDVSHSTWTKFQMMIRKNTSIKSPSENHEKCFDIFKNKGLHMIHINARSLLPKMSEIRLLATRTKAAVISITESWLDESVTNAEVNIHDYRVVRSDRNRHGGGILL